VCAVGGCYVSVHMPRGSMSEEIWTLLGKTRRSALISVPYSGPAWPPMLSDSSNMHRMVWDNGLFERRARAWAILT
jgi:hypothetical protein